MPRFSIVNYMNNEDNQMLWREENGLLVIEVGENFEHTYRYKLGSKYHKWLMKANWVDMNEFGYELTKTGRLRYTWKNDVNNLINQLQTLNDDIDTNEIIIDLTKLSVERIAYLISIHLPLSNNERFFSLDFGNNLYHIYNQKLKISLLSAFDQTFVQRGTEEFGSDTEAIQQLFETNTLTIRKRIRAEGTNINQEIGGEFFSHINTTNMDLSDYGIFNETQFKKYDKNGYFKRNCLFHAITKSLDYNKIKAKGKKTKDKIHLIETLKIFFNNSFTPKKKIHKIFEALKLNVNVRYIDNKKTGDTRLDKHRYGKEDDATLLIGLIDKHYFAITNTIYSKNMLGKDYKGNRSKNLDSWTIIKYMIRNNYGIRDFRFDEKISTHFYNENDELGSIENEIILTTPYQLKEFKEKKRKSRKIFFDCETITNRETHEVYMCDYVDDKGNWGKFDGEDCCKKFLRSFKEDILLIAHNAAYDILFILPYIFGLTGIFKGKRCMGASGKYFGKNGKYYNVIIKDSLNLINTKLSNFSDYFKMKSHKEFMPYELYDEEIFTNRWKKISDAEKYCKNEEEKKLLHHNIKRWNLIHRDGELFDALQYSHKYCLIDCLVLRDGYNIFRGWILEQLDLDIDDILTSASLSQTYMEQQGCFDECFMIGGACRTFINKCVVGGRCMSRNNKKYIINKKLADYDATSLYPTAMERMGYEVGGYLKGAPKILRNKTMKFLNSVDGYFIKIVFKKNFDKKYSFPLLSYMNKMSRTFTNNLEGRDIYIDRISLEDVMKFYEITEEDFEIIEGYYYDEGRNNRIQVVIRKLFDMRLEKKKEKNPIQQLYKLIMNSGYGKTLLKPYDTELRIVDDEEKYIKYVLRNHNRIKQVIPIHNSEKYAIKESVPIISHYNYAHIGVEILSMSKRVMNEVMCLAEDNNINIYYQDTDSMHIEFDKVPKLEILFQEKYGKILNGKNIGQFHVDFGSKILKNEIYASKSVILGKKCYADVLEDGSGDVDYHIRMKGIPHTTLHYTAKKMGLNLIEMYERNITKGINYDLCEGGSRCKWIKNDNMSISMRRKFERYLSFGGEIIRVD